MTPQQFVSHLHTAVVDENVNIYRNLFEKTPVDSATDSYWIDALRFFASIPDKDRDVLFQIVRQTTIDTVANVLGIIDGVNSIGTKARFQLSCRDAVGDTTLSGDLQAIFLSEEERLRKNI